MVSPLPDRCSVCVPFNVMLQLMSRPTLITVTLAALTVDGDSDTSRLQGSATLNSI